MNYNKYWHSSAHVLAAAVKRLWPDVKLGIGPAIKNGFYYEFHGRTFSKQDLEKIEKEMNKIIQKKQKFKKEEVTKKQAKKIFKNEPFKIELLEDLENPTIYRNGDFVDLCTGPHLEHTGKIKHIKLLKVSAAYWRGDQNRESMQRIYGISFKTKKELKQYLNMLEEAEKRDHRKIGKEMELFRFSPLVGQGMPILLPKGMIIRKELVKLVRELNNDMDYREVWTPHVAKLKLWKISGHLEAYKERMFDFKADKTKMGLKPMNCPFHIQVYKNRLRSYKDLPIRYSEFATVYRNEQSGELRGLLRVQAITQDDRHSICKMDQVEEEVMRLFKSAKKLYEIFGMGIEVSFSTRPEKRIGSDKVWDKGEELLEKILKKNKIEYRVDEEEGAFYGPKIDIHAKDAIGRKWQLTTIQLDLFQSKRFDIDYVTDEGKQRPVIIHCAIIGSIERFMGVIIEHFAGKFPVWLSPIQAVVLPITDRNNEYGEKIAQMLSREGIRVEVDSSSNTLDYRIRHATKKNKVPYMIIIGDKEEKKKTISVRDRTNKTRYDLKTRDFIKEIKRKIKNRT